MGERKQYQHDLLAEVPGSWIAESMVANDASGNFRQVSAGTGNLTASSTGPARGNKHLPCIDFDGVPMRLVPSRTEGGFHLYIDKEITGAQYDALLHGLARSGLIERGIYDAYQERGFTMVRTIGTFEPHSRTIAEKRKEQKALAARWVKKNPRTRTASEVSRSRAFDVVCVLPLLTH